MVNPASKLKVVWHKNKSKSSHEEQVSDTKLQSRKEYPQPPQASPTNTPQQPYPETNAHSPSDRNRLSASHPYTTHPSDPHVPNPYSTKSSDPRPGSVSNTEEAYYPSDAHRMPIQSPDPHVNYVCGPSSVNNVQSHEGPNADIRGLQTADPQAMHSMNPNQKSESQHTNSSKSHRSHPSGASQSTGSQPKSDVAKPTTTEIPGLALVGNPGSGKSTILNGFADEIVFPSGISLGSGLTTTLNERCHKGVTLYDTPGLADVDRRKQAGRELDTLLSKHVPIKVAFVVTLERGRVRPEDALTIELVLDAIKHDTRDRFGVIINQVTKRIREEIDASPEKEAKIRRSLTGKHCTSHWCYVNDRSDLVDENDGKLMTSELMHFFWGLPETKPKDVQTVPIDTESMEEKLEKHMEMIEDIKAANAEQLRSMTEELRSQKEKYAAQESQLRHVEQNISNEIHRLEAEADATRAVADAALREGGRQARFEVSQLESARDRPTVVEGYKTMHMLHGDQTEPADGQPENLKDIHEQTDGNMQNTQGTSAFN